MEHTTDPIDITLFDRFLAGECTPEEAVVVQRWMADREGRPALAASLNAGESHASLDPRDVDRWWQVVRERVVTDVDGASRIDVAGGTVRPVSNAVRTRARRSVSRIAAYAFAGAVAVVLGVVGWQQFGVSDGSASAGRVTTYATRAGERADVTLPDGTTITLNVSSRLDIPTNFGERTRTIHLTGQALFTVPHAAKIPFTVVTPQSTTRVLGTTFMVRNYASDSVATIAVREGKVAVGNSVLTAHEQAMGSANRQFVVYPVDPAQFGFADGVLSFDWVPLSQAIAELNRWYDVDIRIADPALATHQIKATFAIGSRSNLPSILELALNARVVRDGQVLTLYRK